VGIKLYSTNINTKIINHQHEFNVEEEDSNSFRVWSSFSLRNPSSRTRGNLHIRTWNRHASPRKGDKQTNAKRGGWLDERSKEIIIERG